jgi:hypothetical protein
MFANRVGIQTLWTFFIDFSFFLCHRRHHYGFRRLFLFLLTGLHLLSILGPLTFLCYLLSDLTSPMCLRFYLTLCSIDLRFCVYKSSAAEFEMNDDKLGLGAEEVGLKMDVVPLFIKS